MNALQKLIREEERAKWENLLAYQIRMAGLPAPKRQYKFHPKRQFKADFCYEAKRLLLEVDGGIHMEKSGHTSGVGYERDRRRDLLAWELGWTVLRVTPGMVSDLTALKAVERLFGKKS